MKPESTFIKSVNAYIPQVYAEKMNNPYRRGTADVWYSGGRADWWIEYKWGDGKLTALQERWLSNRYDEGRNVAVILGSKEGGVLLLHKAWEKLPPKTAWQSAVLTRKQLAEWILANVGASPCLSPQSSSTPQKSSRRRTASSSRVS